MSIMKSLATGSLVALMSGGALAGKVNLPKAGNFQFQFCWVGEERSLSEKDKVSVSHYRSVANTLSEPAGQAFDRMGALCYGTYTNLNGHQQEFGVCEMTDQDGDKWWMEYHGSADGSGGTYTSAHGTGKYDGMMVKGQWINDSWPGAAKDLIQGCNPNKGSYKLK